METWCMIRPLRRNIGGVGEDPGQVLVVGGEENGGIRVGATAAEPLPYATDVNIL